VNGGYLLLRRGAGVWALSDRAVAAVRGSATGVTVTTPHAELVADEVLGIARDLAVSAPGSLLKRLWPTRCAGLAVHAGLPVVVIDPESPPPALRREGAAAHDQ
jgi:hypothetical protein